MVKIISISLSDEEKAYLDDMEISPTALMKQKILELMTSSIAQRKRVKELETTVTKLAERLEQTYKYVESKGLSEDLEKHQSTQNGNN